MVKIKIEVNKYARSEPAMGKKKVERNQKRKKVERNWAICYKMGTRTPIEVTGATKMNGQTFDALMEVGMQYEVNLMYIPKNTQNRTLRPKFGLLWLLFLMDPYVYMEDMRYPP